MKALSVKQPWAWLIATERKSIETRTWPTSYRGDLLICSGKKPVSDINIREWFHENFGLWAMMQLKFGVALCTAEIVDCRRMTADDEKAAQCVVLSGAYSWILKNIRPLAPFPVKGQQGIFEVKK